MTETQEPYKANINGWPAKRDASTTYKVNDVQTAIVNRNVGRPIEKLMAFASKKLLYIDGASSIGDNGASSIGDNHQLRLKGASLV